MSNKHCKSYERDIGKESFGEEGAGRVEIICCNVQTILKDAEEAVRQTGSYGLSKGGENRKVQDSLGQKSRLSRIGK